MPVAALPRALLLLLPLLTAPALAGQEYTQQSAHWPDSGSLRFFDLGGLPMRAPTDLEALRKIPPKPSDLHWDADRQILTVDFSDGTARQSRLTVFYRKGEADWLFFDGPAVLDGRTNFTYPPYRFLGWSANMGQLYTDKDERFYAMREADRLRTIVSLHGQTRWQDIPELGAFTPWSDKERTVGKAVEKGDADAVKQALEGLEPPRFGWPALLLNELRRFHEPQPDLKRLEREFKAAKGNPEARLAAFANTLQVMRQWTRFREEDERVLGSLYADYPGMPASNAVYNRLGELVDDQRPVVAREYAALLKTAPDTLPPGEALFRHSVNDLLACSQPTVSPHARRITMRWFGNLDLDALFTDAPSDYRRDLTTSIRLLKDSIKEWMLLGTPAQAYEPPVLKDRLYPEPGPLSLKLSAEPWNTAKLHAEAYPVQVLQTSTSTYANGDAASRQAEWENAKRDLQRVEEELAAMEGAPLGREVQGGANVAIHRFESADGRTGYSQVEMPVTYRFGVGEDARAREARRTELLSRQANLQRWVKAGPVGAESTKVETYTVDSVAYKYCGTHLLPITLSLGNRSASAEAEWKIHCSKDYSVGNLSAWESRMRYQDPVNFANGMIPAIRAAASRLVADSDDADAPWIRYWLGTGPLPEVGGLSVITALARSDNGEPTPFWKDDVCAKANH